VAQTVKITPATGLLEFIGDNIANKPVLQHDNLGNLTLTLQASKKFTVGGNLKVNGKVTVVQQALTDGSTITWNFNSGANATVTLGGARTLAITGMEAGDTGLILVKQDQAGGKTLALPGGSIIVGGGAYTASAAPGATDILGVYFDGAAYWWTIGYNTVTPPLTSVGITGSDFVIANSPLTSNGTIGLALATVNSNVGQFGSATAVPVITVNAKGLVTAVSTTNISIPTNLDSLTDVTITSAATGQLLQFNGSQWVNWTPNFLTSYTETDTLASVTGRGATTNTAITLNGDVTLGNSADLIFRDTSGTFPTSGKGFDWTLNDDGARIYAIQPSQDSIDLVFQLRDNATTNDRFVFWVDDYQGAAFDKYPLIIRGGTEFDLVDSGLFVRGTQVLTNGRVLQNVTGNISMFTNDSNYATQTYVNTAVSNLVDSAPGTLDTLNELAAALGDDPNFATTITTLIGTKQAQLNGTGFVKISGTTISYDNSTYLTSYTETDTLASVTGRGATTNTASTFRGGLYAQKAQADNNYTTAALWTESYDNTTTGIAFHISGNVGKFLEMRTDGILYWEDRQVWTAGNLINLSQLSNDPGYITASSLNSYLPLTGGTLTGGLIGTTGSFSSSGSTNTFTINHDSGSGLALSITKGGNGEGLYVNKTSGSGNAVTIIGTLNATAIVKNGGTSSQYLMADGTVSTLSNPVTGTGTVNFISKFTGAGSLGNSQIFDNGTNVGIGGITTPQKSLDVVGSAGIIASFGTTISPGQFAGIHFGYSESASNNDSYKKSALVFERTDNNNQGANASGKIHFLLHNRISTSANSLSDAVVTIDSDENGTIGSVRMGVGTRNPTTPLHVIGTLQIEGEGSNTFYATDASGSYARTFGGQLYSFRDSGGSVITTINTTSGVITTTGGNSTQWNTAFGWGNHAGLYATQAYVNTAVSNLVDAAPGTLDTLNELAAALGDDPNFATTVATSISGKVAKAGDTMTGTLTINRNVAGLIFNRDAVSDYNGIYYSTATAPKWFIGMRENLGLNNHIHYSEELGRDVLTLDVTTGNATVFGTIAASNFSGSSSGTNTGDQTTISGNAGSATVLQTARTLTIGATGKTFNGSANVAWSLAEIGAYAASNPAGYITGYSETDTLDSVIGRGNSTTRTTLFYQTSGTTIESVAPGNRGLTILQDSPGRDAYIAFHIENDYAGYFGLGGAENDLVWGGWSVGAVRHRIWHSGNLTNLNQLSNGPGYITGYTETDTLASVTARGATTTTTLTLGKVITTGLYGHSIGGNNPIWQYDASNLGYGIVYNEGSPDTLRIDVSGQAVTGTPDFLVGPDYAQVNGNTVWHAGNDGAGSGLDADLLDGYHASGSVGANTVVIRDVNGYIFANYINTNVSETENPSISSFFTSNGDGWLRKSTIAHVRNSLGNYGGWLTQAAADPLYVNVTGDSMTGPLVITGSTSGQELFAVNGVNGRLFTVSDDLSNSLFSVNTVAGLPVIEAFANNTVNLGPFSAPIVINASGISTPSHGTSANWHSAYNDTITSAAVSGTTSKTLTLTQRDGGTVTATWTDIDTDTDTDQQTLSISGSTLTISGGNSITLPASGISQATADTLYVSVNNNTSLNSDSRNRRGVTRLYRYDDDSDYSVQHYWTGSYWHLRGFNGDTFHADVQVGYADSAGSAATASALTSMNISQFTNNSGYITSYTETDTLQSVTSRGSSTDTDIRIKRPANKVDNASCTELPSRVEFNNAFVAGSSGYTVFHYPTPSVFRIYGDYDGNIGGLQPDIHLGLGYLTVKNGGSTIGNIGVGEINPANRLQIGSVGSTGYGGNDLAIGNGTQVMAFYQASTISAWYTNTSFALMPSGAGSLGRLGIGNDNPQFKLDVTGTGRFTGNVSIGTNYNGFALNINGTTYIIGANLFLNVGQKIVNTSDTSSIAFSDDVLDVKGALIPITDSTYNLGTTTLRWRTIYAADLNLTGAATINGSTVWHAGNLTNLNQLANGPGYITGYTETDTLASVTARGNTTTGSITVQGGQGAAETTDGFGLEIMGNYTNGQYNHRLAKFDKSGGVPLYVQLTTGAANVWANSARFGTYTGNGYEFEVYGATKVNGDFVSTGQINASGGNSSQWNSAFSWGNHSGLYAPINAPSFTGNITLTGSHVSGFGILRIDSADDMLISTESASNGWNGLRLKNEGSEYAFFGKPSNQTDKIVIDFDFNSTNEFEFSNTGTLTVADRLIELSSIRYKTQVESLTPALDKVLQLRPVYYTKIGGTGSTEIGLIAEEVAEIYPELVKYNGDGEVDGINYTRIAPILIKTIQEQQELIKNLTKRIDDLENR
jgi:hypothetical protein